MDEYNVPVGQEEVGSAQDDAAQARQDGANEATALSAILNGDGSADTDPQGQAQEGKQGKPEDTARYESGIRGRINAEVRRALEAQEQAFSAKLAEYEHRFSELQGITLGREADALVAAGEFKNRDTALEYLKLKNGVPAQAAEKPPAKQEFAQERDAKGRFAPSKADGNPAEARAKMLLEQNQAILASGGPDALALYRQDDEIKRKVHSGEWDFKDVALAHMAKQMGRPSGVPGPVRSPNNARVTRSFKTMSDKEFAEFERRIEGGETFDARR